MVAPDGVLLSTVTGTAFLRMVHQLARTNDATSGAEPAPDAGILELLSCVPEVQERCNRVCVVRSDLTYLNLDGPDGARRPGGCGVGARPRTVEPASDEHARRSCAARSDHQVCRTSRIWSM